MDIAVVKMMKPGEAWVTGLCFAYKSVVYLHLHVSPSPVRSEPVVCCLSPRDMTFLEKSETEPLLPLSPPPRCMFVYVWLCGHVYAHLCFPSADIKSITRRLWHSGMWPPGGVVAWQSAAVDISHMGLLRLTSLVGCCCSLDIRIYDPKHAASQSGRGPSQTNTYSGYQCPGSIKSENSAWKLEKWFSITWRYNFRA